MPARTCRGNSRRSRVSPFRYHLSVSPLVPSGRRPGHDLDALRAELTERERRLDARSAEVVRTRADYDAFRIRYRQEVGLLHDELDRLELDLAEAELGILKERLADAGDPPSESAAQRPEPQPRFTSDAVRRLFRDVAKAIHPDLATDSGARDRR